MADFEFDNELIEWRGPAPHDLVPVRAWVRRVEALEPGGTVSVGLDVASRGGRQANGQGPTS